MLGMPELIIPARSLDYGTYKITFNARMWDDSIADPNWTKKLPFENDAFTYIKIKPSSLKAMLVKGGVTMVTRGFGQALILEPYLYSSDPDYPDMQVNTALTCLHFLRPTCIVSMTECSFDGFVVR